MFSVPLFLLHKKMKEKEATNMEGTTPQATKVFTHCKSAKKVFIYIIMERQRSYEMYYM